MNSVQRSLGLARVCVRQYAIRESSSNTTSHFKALKGKQQKFQADDGLPVFLKGGVMDKILYQTTMLMCLVGSGMMLKLFWDLSVPKK